VKENGKQKVNAARFSSYFSLNMALRPLSIAKG
jgi:hypothetical protein